MDQSVIIVLIIYFILITCIVGYYGYKLMGKIFNMKKPKTGVLTLEQREFCDKVKRADLRLYQYWVDYFRTKNKDPYKGRVIGLDGKVVNEGDKND